MRIEAIIVCKDYADFLAHTLPENVELLDRVVVVTHPKDGETKQLCSEYGVDFVETEIFHENGDKFNKGRAINLGLSHLKHDDWLLHLDADILLPHKFRDMLRHSKLNKECIYGADRQNASSYEHWEEHKHKITPQHRWRYLVTPNREFPLGARLLHQEYGYCPIGCFQLWHSSKRRKYPVICGSAEHSDVLFSVQWPRENRILLPEFFVYHLESEVDSKMGANWEGRKTKRFEHHEHKHRHHGRHHPGPPPKPYCK